MQLTPTSRKNVAVYHKCLLLALALVCKIAMTVQLRKYMQAGIPVETLVTADSPAIWPARSIPPVYMAFEANSVRYELDGPVSDAEWSSLAPNDGLIYLGDEHQVYSISMFHELRCLNIIRQEVAQVMSGKDTVAITPVLQHCLNYVRQMILCRSNTMLNGFVQGKSDAGETTLHGTHQCNDWGEIYKEVERNQEEYGQTEYR